MATERRGRIRRWLRRLVVFLLALATLVILAQLLPQKLLLQPGMERFDSSHFTVWARAADRRSAIELRSALEDRMGQAREFFGLPEPSGNRSEVFLYPDRLAFTLHRAGLWAAWSDTAGVVVERRGTTLLVVSPDNPGLSHGREAVIKEACAAMIRPLVEGQAPGASPWLSEGLTGMLAGSPRDDEDPQDLPDDDILADRGSFAFLAKGGDRYADSFAAWLILSFGREKVLELCRAGGDWKAALGRSAESLVSEWKLWMARGRSGDPRLWREMPPGNEQP